MTLTQFLSTLSSQPDTIEFDDTMAVIDQYYTFTPTQFTNGDLINEAGQNNGSCKIFAFGQHHHLSEQHTLACFGRYYREDVRLNPSGTDHQNIRQFMRTGWAGIHFEHSPLADKGT